MTDQERTPAAAGPLRGPSTESARTAGQPEPSPDSPDQRATLAGDAATARRGGVSIGDLHMSEGIYIGMEIGRGFARLEYLVEQARHQITATARVVDGVLARVKAIEELTSKIWAAVDPTRAVRLTLEPGPPTEQKET